MDSTGSGTQSHIRWLPWAGLVLALVTHGTIVASVLRQPFDVSARPVHERTPIWWLHNDTVHRVGPAGDFFAVYHAGVCVTRGVSPYADRQPGERTPYYFPFRYLPLVAQTLGRAAAELAPRTAYWLWVGILELLLATLLLSFRRCTRGWVRWLAAYVLLLSSPYFLEVYMGQFTFAAVSLTGLALLLIEPRPGVGAGWARRIIGAVVYTPAVLLKVFPLAVLPALVRVRRARLLAAALVITLVAGGPHFLAHPEDWHRFYEAYFGRPFGGIDAGNYGFSYWLFILGRHIAPSWVDEHWPFFADTWRNAVLAGTAGLVLLTRRPRLILTAVALLLAHFVSYAHVWEHHMSAVLVLGLLLLREHWPAPRADTPLGLGGTAPAPAERATLPPAAIVSLLAVLILALPTPFVFLDVAKDPSVVDPSVGWSSAARLLLAGSKALPTLALYIVGVAALCRRDRTPV
jgi:hypothetical protein